MQINSFGRWITFLSGSVIGGLALAFVAIAVRPELIQRRPAGVSQTPAVASSVAPPELAPASPATPTAASAAPMPARVTYADAVERAAPAVVNVYTARLVTERVAPTTLEELFGFWPRYRRRIERSLGSGVIVDERGHIVTNHHVIAKADAIRVQLADGRVADARIVGRDPDTDLAVLKIDLQPLPVVPFGRSDQLRVGDVVLAIGNPLGLSQTVTHGIVSATGRGQLGVATFEDFIQTDAPINFGNSGGALIDTKGALVGINTAIVAKNLGVEGIGFAIPVNMVRGVMQEIIEHGRVIRGWIGIEPEEITDAQAAELGLRRGGVVVAHLYVGSPAQQAGLQPGDVLLEIDGVPVRSVQDVITRIATRKPGTFVTLRVLRGSRSFEAKVAVRERYRP